MNLKPDSRTGSVWIPANALKAPLVKAATWVSHGIGGAWEFSNGTDDTLVGNILIPVDFNRDISSLFGIGWSADGVSPGNCEWQLAYNILAPGQDATAPAQATITQVAAASVTSNGMIVTLFSNEMSKPSESDVCFQLNVKRLAAGALDTIADTVELMGMCIHYSKKEGM